MLRNFPERNSVLHSIISNHQELIDRLKAESWLNTDPSIHGINGRGHSMYEPLRQSSIAVFSRELDGIIYLPPGIQRGITQFKIGPRTDELLLEGSAYNLKLTMAFMMDIQRLQIAIQRVFSAEELFKAMGLTIMPRLRDLNLDKQSANMQINHSDARPEWHAHPEPHGLIYVGNARIDFPNNQVDRVKRNADLGLMELAAASFSNGSPCQL